MESRRFMVAKAAASCGACAPRCAHAASLIGGLLSSSCCLLQILLNFLSLGCAGFNKLLGPLRPQVPFHAPSPPP